MNDVFHLRLSRKEERKQPGDQVKGAEEIDNFATCGKIKRKLFFMFDLYSSHRGIDAAASMENCKILKLN